jgi:hypothetical protein
MKPKTQRGAKTPTKNPGDCPELCLDQKLIDQAAITAVFRFLRQHCKNLNHMSSRSRSPGPKPRLSALEKHALLA